MHLLRGQQFLMQKARQYQRSRLLTVDADLDQVQVVMGFAGILGLEPEFVHVQ